MIVPRALVFIVLMCLAPWARAQTITVRSGEHDTFSRLVMLLPENANWTLEPNDRQATLLHEL